MTRPLQAPPAARNSGKRIRARVKPNARRMEIHIPTDTRPEVWNADRGKELGAARVDDDREKNQEESSRSSVEPRLSEVRLRSEEVPHKGVHMLGIVREGELHLHPISQTHQFRPTLTYMDYLTRKNRRGRGGAGSDSDSDDGPPPDPDEPAPPPPPKKEKKKSGGETREVTVSARKNEERNGVLMQGNITAWRREMLQTIHAEEDEEWANLDFRDENTSTAEDTFERIFSQKSSELQFKSELTDLMHDIQQDM
ncbi:DNA-directed RNA polymerase III subunit Rpc5 [Schizophyllum amplum]|uniref:DNA-directed RNA polymerase III subunit Rpc5 n=1 Tax=Schizophyllum amplum TaxID=97359 RepID=A0A550CLQ6_9AGAR|nr:DNA-directed RNA polymerase III subunit Rpc5 [Auriculariopsis ampla]